MSFRPILIFLAVLPLLFAYYPTQVQDFVPYAAPVNSTFAVANFSYANLTAYAIISKGKPQAIMLQSFPLLPYSPLTDQQELEAALHSYYLASGSSPFNLEDFTSVHESVDRIRGKYDPGEDKCRILLGTDRYPCTSFDTCQLACYSVTSFCQPVALGAGRVFINIVWDFENDSRELTLAYEAEDWAYAHLEKNGSQQAVLDYLSSLERLNRAATNAAASPLYDAYSYCFIPDYSLTALTSLQLTAQKHYRSAESFYALSKEAAYIRNNTLAGIEKRKSMQIPVFPKKNQTAINESEYMVNRSVPPAAKSVDNSLRLLAPAAAGFMMLLALAAGFYLVTRRKGGLKQA